MRISTKTHLDSVRILELARSYFRLANPHPPLPTYTHTIYFTDEKTESLPVDISSYNSSACFEKKTRCENTRSRSTCGEDCRCLGKIFPSPYLSIFESLPVKHIYYFCKKKKKLVLHPQWTPCQLAVLVWSVDFPSVAFTDLALEESLKSGLQFSPLSLQSWCTRLDAVTDYGALSACLSHLSPEHLEFLATSASTRNGSWWRWTTNLSSAGAAARRIMRPGACSIRYSAGRVVLS